MPKIKGKNEKSNLAKPLIIVKDIIPNVFIIPKAKTIPQHRTQIPQQIPQHKIRN